MVDMEAIKEGAAAKATAPSAHNYANSIRGIRGIVTGGSAAAQSGEVFAGEKFFNLITKAAAHSCNK